MTGQVPRSEFMKRLVAVSFAAVLALGLGACGLIYKQNIQQGNALEDEDLDELYVGMNKRQVMFVLGTPSIQDPFNQDRWDYVQTFSRRGGDIVQRTVTLRFENEVLTEIIGVDDDLSADTGDTVASARPARQDPQKIAIESAQEEALEEPEVTGLGERSASEREYERDMKATQQRAEDDTTSPDIDG